MVQTDRARLAGCRAWVLELPGREAVVHGLEGLLNRPLRHDSFSNDDDLIESDDEDE